MPGPPPRQHEHERRDTPWTHLFILTRRICKDYYDGQIIFGDLVGLKVTDIYLTGDAKLRKKKQSGNLSRPGDRTRARVTGTHATACPTAVDVLHLLIFNFLESRGYNLILLKWIFLFVVCLGRNSDNVGRV